MKTISYGILALVLAAVCGVSQTRSAEETGLSRPDRERLIGTWRLASIEGPDGKLLTTGVPTGMLIYTRDGHMSVQLMQPESGAALTNDYFLNGYEASFGSYDLDEANHTITHHVQGSITHLLVGKDLPRGYHFNDDRNLIITSTRAEEHWMAIWEHY